jgi:Ca2+-binding EF-hand superfamily protein
MQVVDTDSDGFISKDEMFKFFASVFAVLVVFSANTKSVSTNDLRDVVGLAASEKTADFFSVADTNEDDLVDYEEFVKVYREHPEVVTWLHLFNADSPPSFVASHSASLNSSRVSANESDKSEHDGGSDAAVSERDSSSAGLSAAGYQRSEGSLSERNLTGSHSSQRDLNSTLPTDANSSVQDDKPALRITITSAGDVLEITKKFYSNFGILKQRLNLLSPEHLVKLFQEYAPSGGLVYEDFNRLMKEFLPEDSCVMLRVELRCLFQVFDENKDGIIDMNEFIAGLYLLCTADDSDKLRLSFEVYYGDSLV